MFQQKPLNSIEHTITSIAIGLKLKYYKSEK